MKRDEWYNSVKFKKLRLLNNVASEIYMKAQYLYDIFEIIMAEEPTILVSDKLNLAERQLRIVQLETRRLQDACGNLDRMLQPRSFDDWDEYGPKNPTDENK